MGDIRLRNVTKTFGEGDNSIIAVDNLDIDISDGEFLTLVGPSGCGKSTTLRCIAGLEIPSEGDTYLNGEDISGKEAKERDIAMVFQNYALYPHMTARDNMSFGLKMSTDLSEKSINDRVEETAEMLDIVELLDKRPSELSGGQQQRVALGRAIVRDPEVFLMDEPLSNLDAKLRTQMRTELQNIQYELGVTTIYVTHDQTEAMTMGDRIAIMKEGRIQQLATPLECYHEPVNQFVAGFIGSPSMNFFQVQLNSGALQHAAFQYEVSESLERELSTAPDELLLGIRPEDIVFDEPEQNPIEATVDVFEPLGNVSFATLRIGETTFKASISGEELLQAGDTVTVGFPEDRIHIFEAEGGNAVHNRESPIDESELQARLA